MDQRSDERSAAAGGTPCARARLRLAFAAALIAVPLLGVLANAPLREEIGTHVGLVANHADAGRPSPDATVYAASAAPDHALLDANDVRRALPAAPSPAVAGLENTTL